MDGYKSIGSMVNSLIDAGQKQAIAREFRQARIDQFMQDLAQLTSEEVEDVRRFVWNRWYGFGVKGDCIIYAGHRMQMSKSEDGLSMTLDITPGVPILVPSEIVDPVVWVVPEVVQ